jgi:ATP-dependent Zn protease
MCGLSLYSYGYGDADSNTLKAAQEQAIAAEVEKAYRKAKEILALNAEYFEKVAAALAKKKLLSAADMQKIKSECKIVPVAL